MLFVGNHQTYALDVGFLVEALVKERGIMPRGLAHPAIFGVRLARAAAPRPPRPPARAPGPRPRARASRSRLAPPGRPVLTAGAPRAQGLNSNPQEADVQNFQNFMTTFGAVPVRPRPPAHAPPCPAAARAATRARAQVGGRNFFRLLQQKEAVLLFPGAAARGAAAGGGACGRPGGRAEGEPGARARAGGVREAYKRKGEKYRVFWPERSEFVRMAAKYGATIVPFAGIGCEDSVNMLLDSQQARLSCCGARMQAARRGRPARRTSASGRAWVLSSGRAPAGRLRGPAAGALRPRPAPRRCAACRSSGGRWRRARATTSPPLAGALGAARAAPRLWDSGLQAQRPVRCRERVCCAPGAAARGADAARRGRGVAAGDKEFEELFIQPVALPSVPQRFYFQFRAPVATSPADLRDRSRCDEIYRQARPPRAPPLRPAGRGHSAERRFAERPAYPKPAQLRAQVKGEVEGGIAYLLQQRERDPYRDFLPRTVYEASWGGRQAPSFEP